MSWCNHCDRCFNSDRSLWQHIDNSVFHECNYCYHHFTDQDDYDDHCNEEHIYCQDCDTWHADSNRFHRHNKSENSDRYCADCRRTFIGASQYRSHRNSSLHRPKDIQCPYRSRGCDGAFVSVAALALHLESGSCVSGMTRADVNTRVITLDRNRVIVDSSRLIGNGTTTYRVTGRAWNGDAWECYLCNATMDSRAALNQHLNSPKHGDKIYLCPCPTCQTRFTTLSGIMQHVESNSCGVQRFKIIQNTLDQLTSSMRRITV